MALQRQEIFNNMPKYLIAIKKTVLKLDPGAEVYLFGSSATREHNYSSDIDILVITKLQPAKVITELWKVGIEDPFEIHVHTNKEAEFFRKTAKLTRI
jgi:predicted nucleotidyltransferase